jgi:MOSC domain-containing protein YiiM
MPTVVAVSRKPTHGFSKEPQLYLTLIAGEGIEGDCHRGTTTQHLYLQRKDPTLPNLAQVHLFAAEQLDELRILGFDIQPGGLGENILTRNLDLLTLPKATLLHIGDTTLEVTGLRTPCSQIDGFQQGLQNHLWGERSADGKRPRRAGIMSIVLTGGTISPNDPIRVELPPEPHLPLGPV